MAVHFPRVVDFRIIVSSIKHDYQIAAVLHMLCNVIKWQT